MFDPNIDKIIDCINKNKSFVILMHENPDGDCIGAGLALRALLLKLKKNVSIFSKDSIPNFLSFLPQIETISRQETLLEADVCILLECSSIDRSGYNQSFIRNKILVNIDHHATNDLYAQINWVDAEMSSTSEQIYYIYKTLKLDMDLNSALFLYVGILTDTNRFQNKNTHKGVFSIIEDLVNKGIDINDTYRRIYGAKTLPYLKVLGYVLTSFELFYDGKVSIVSISKNLLEQYDIKYNEMDGIIEQLRDIEGVEVAIVLKEVTNTLTKVSLRSTGKVLVDGIALKYNGGGHKLAAGCRLEKNLADSKTEIISMIGLYL
jgi:bifunctional oligoribonuclease and PAP phosphatase NrnA